MPTLRDTRAFAALQYLTWAIEETERLGSAAAAHHTRQAMADLYIEFGDQQQVHTGKNVVQVG